MCTSSHTVSKERKYSRRNEGNFNGHLNGLVNRSPTITSYRAFQGDYGRVMVSVEQYMHSAEWDGIYGNGDMLYFTSPVLEGSALIWSSRPSSECISYM